MDRVRFWKDEAERCWRAGDMKGFAEAEKQLESWRLWETLKQEEAERERQVRSK